MEAGGSEGPRSIPRSRLRPEPTKTLSKKQNQIKPNYINNKEIIHRELGLAWPVEQAYSFLLLFYALSSEEIRQLHEDEKIPVGLECAGSLWHFYCTGFCFFTCQRISAYLFINVPHYPL